ncbi:hypothetical protein EVAR_103526_1 [Eumeta japonica]|uniref:Uncharacterized protein n=1 Tax=Eumeta variegata TaxID=151549 RepID=A0A4C1YV44_EUMVA|nr:hypothetical protein EVAR_103526_1 [Eumeta japonica]
MLHFDGPRYNFPAINHTHADARAGWPSIVAVPFDCRPRKLQYCVTSERMNVTTHRPPRQRRAAYMHLPELTGTYRTHRNGHSYEHARHLKCNLESANATEVWGCIRVECQHMAYSTIINSRLALAVVFLIAADASPLQINLQYNARNSAAIKLVTKVSQWRKIGWPRRRRKGQGVLNLHITSFAGKVPCVVLSLLSSFGSKI